ncbi:type VII secretion-associated serine protease mycosin [Streptomyces catenulae]|uniref:Type VII secretion-associated serine protease mycosin n=1 Tax=Streptomyces catenulae TaxID=66875 RepID=A0ABV2YUF2_9ACTN|nr:type VII secretion-associated serine protease mycosin [Streptomyces catenulae]
MSFTRTLRAVSGAAVVGALLFGTAPVALADQMRDQQWALNSLHAEEAWKVSTGKGVTVAVIDSGVNGDAPDLKGNVLPGKNFSSGDPADQETKNDHGTSMASLIAGHGHGPGNSDGVMGLAPDAKILPVKHSDSQEDTYGTSYADSLRYAVDHGAKVVNMSIGGVGSPTEEEKSAIAYAAKHDVLLVASSGNNGSDNPSYPAAAPGVLAVGAVDRHQKVWDDSNYGSYVMLTAPGVEIRSAAASKPYRYASGTSDSTAYVSAAAALLRSKFPDLTAGQIANRLVKTAKAPAGTDTPDPYYGYGVIDPYKALTADIPAGSKNGPLKSPEAGDDGLMKPSNTSDATEPRDTSNIRAVFGIIGFSLIVLFVIVGITVLVVVKKKRKNGPPPGGPTGFGGPGGPGLPPQQGMYQQPGAYQQQPGGQGPYPPAPPGR